MKKIALALSVLAAALALWIATPSKVARADIENAPFIPEIDARFNALEQGNHLVNNKFPMGSSDGHWVQQEVQATYNFAVQTGSSTANPNGLGAGIYDLGVSLPANAVITQTGVYSITKPTTSTGGTLAFYCQNQYNLLNPTAAASFAGASAAIAGTQNNTITNWSTVTAKCDIAAKIATGALTAGKVTVFINYMTHQ